MSENLENTKKQIILVLSPEADVVSLISPLVEYICDNSRISIKTIGVKKNMVTFFTSDEVETDDIKTVHRILNEHNINVTSQNYDNHTFWLF